MGATASGFASASYHTDGNGSALFLASASLGVRPDNAYATAECFADVHLATQEAFGGGLRRLSAGVCDAAGSTLRYDLRSKRRNARGLGTGVRTSQTLRESLVNSGSLYEPGYHHLLRGCENIPPSPPARVARPV